ncbi:MAG: hypothetical protein JO000_12325 [Alphaproteobacteria bacterium]|nr:hypothetical protein [Alphaproteobacteria bacterium]
MVKATKMTLAAVLLAAGTTFAMAQAGGGGGGAGGEPPHGSDAHAPSVVQKQGDDTRGTPAPGAGSQAAITGGKHKARRHTARRHHHMSSMPTGMKNNSTGNMNTKGTGRGTTGTGGPAGSGNR